MTSIAPWLSVPDGNTAADFYIRAFGAAVAYRLDDGDTLIVARLAIASGAEFWIQAEPGGSGLGSPVRMIVTVDEPDVWFARAVAAGAGEIAPVHDEHGWRTGRVQDPYGHDWEFSRAL